MKAWKHKNRREKSTEENAVPRQEVQAESPALRPEQSWWHLQLPPSPPPPPHETRQVGPGPVNEAQGAGRALCRLSRPSGMELQPRPLTVTWSSAKHVT